VGMHGATHPISTNLTVVQACVRLLTSAKARNNRRT